MRRYAQTALLFLLGGMLLKLAVTGAYARYVVGAHLPWLILAGLGLVAVAGVTLWRDIRTLGRPGDDDATAPMKLGGLFGTVTLSAPDRAQPSSEEAPEDEPATGQRSTVDYRERAVAAGLAAAAHEGLTTAEGASLDGSDGARSDEVPSGLGGANAPTAVFGTLSSDPTAVPAPRASVEPVDPFDPALPAAPASSAIVAGTRAGWALLVAALAVLLLAPPALGTDPATRLGTIAPTADTQAPLPAGDPVSLSLVDYVSHAAGGGQALAGRQIRLVGFVLAGPHGEPYLARLAVGCCAAGARPVKVGLTGDLPGLLTPGAWIAATGTYSELVDQDPVNGAQIPYLSVVEVTDLEPPTDPYER
jgi:uncharacterized repeat protein (TIGR03943 family)